MNSKLVWLLIAFVMLFGCTSFFNVNKCYDHHMLYTSMTSPSDKEYVAIQSGRTTCIFDNNLNFVKSLLTYRNFLWLNSTSFVIDMNGTENCLGSQYCLWFQNINNPDPDKIIPLPITKEPWDISISQSFDKKYLLVNSAYNVDAVYGLSSVSPLVIMHNLKGNFTYEVWLNEAEEWYELVNLINNSVVFDKNESVFDIMVVDIENALVVDTFNDSTFVGKTRPINCLNNSRSERCNSDLFSLDRYGIYSYGDHIAISHDGKHATYGFAIYSLEEYNQSMVIAKIKSINVSISEVLQRYLGYDINKIEFSPDDRYIAMSGTYSISAKSLEGHISGLGFVIIVDTETKDLVFVNTGGTFDNNYAHFAWTQDGKMRYLFDGETIRDLKTVDPEHPTIDLWSAIWSVYGN